MSNENGRARHNSERRGKRDGESHHAQPHDADNDPPYSRLFVVAGKKITERDLFELFSHSEICNIAEL